MTAMPVLFISHGAPDFALKPGRLGPQLRHLAGSFPRPDAILVISPHWMTEHPRVTASAQPETIHDFRGFDPALNNIRYPASGDPLLAADVVEALKGAG